MVSKNNGNPRFNFRKLPHTTEIEMNKIKSRMERLSAKLPTAPDTELDDLIEEIQSLEHQFLLNILEMVEYLPSSYLIDGVDPEQVDFSDPEAIFKVLAFASTDRIALKVSEERRALAKN